VRSSLRFINTMVIGIVMGSAYGFFVVPLLPDFLRGAGHVIFLVAFLVIVALRNEALDKSDRTDLTAKNDDA